MRRQFLAVGLIAVLVLALACTTTATPTPTATPEATATPTATATATPTPTPRPTPTPVPAPTAIPNTTLSVIDVVRRVTPSVVHIQIEGVQLSMLLQPVPVQGVGTGIINDESGYIVTNNHVVQDAQQITVTLANGESYDAQLIGGDLFTDLAVIKIDAPNLVPAQFGDSSALELGEDVIAIGHALNLPGGPTVTKGVVSAKERFISVGPRVTLNDVIQTDAAINPGNSGGPMVNLKGEVVGINSVRLQGAEGLGFAIGMSGGRPVIEDLIQFGRVQRAFLGIDPVNLTPAMAAQLDLPVDEGVIIAGITEGSPGDKAGLRQGDVIIRVSDKDVSHTGDLIDILQQYKPSDRADITFFRNAQQRTAQVEFGTPP